MKVNLDERYGQLIPISIEIENDKEVGFLLDQLRPKGEWITDGESIFENYKRCSNCNEGAEWLEGGSQFLSKFCPNCGADLRGDTQ